ncbi:MAG: hypothetical protein J6P05_06215 [Lachnospiraceae bacterium]|nr:hypothetical protein [Lachnospiraceae bacterium]
MVSKRNQIISFLLLFMCLFLSACSQGDSSTENGSATESGATMSETQNSSISGTTVPESQESANVSLDSDESEDQDIQDSSSDNEPGADETEALEPSANAALSENETAVAASDIEGMSKSINSFNWSLYKEANPDSNIFYSPYSIASALILADLGAEGQTKAEIEKTLNISDLAVFLQSAHDYAAKQHGTTKISNASALWLDKSLELSENYEEDFEKPARESLDADFHQADFKNDLDTIKEEIKAWVNENTDGMISNYESIVAKDTIASLLNAIYFYGEWMEPFDANDSYDSFFFGTKDRQETRMMRHVDIDLRYVPDFNGISALALPYSDGDLEMDIFIPNTPPKRAPRDEESAEAAAGKDIGEIWGGFEDELLRELDNAEKTKISTLILPKFQMDSTFEGLKDALKNMGLKNAFSDNADFNRLAKLMKLSDIAHKAKIEVDEEGSRAAAVTEITIELLGMAPTDEETIDFIVNQPFIYMIRDRSNGLVLFMGRVNYME